MPSAATIHDVPMVVCINMSYGYNICFVQSADKLKMGEVEAS